VSREEKRREEKAERRREKNRDRSKAAAFNAGTNSFRLSSFLLNMLSFVARLTRLTRLLTLPLFFPPVLYSPSVSLLPPLFPFFSPSLDKLDSIRSFPLGTSLIESLNSVTLAAGREPKWAKPHCGYCMSEEKAKTKKDLGVFTNKAIQITTVPNNGTVPGTGTPSDGEDEASDDDRADGGVLGNAARRSARVSRGGGKKRIFVNSSDMLGKVRLQLFQELG